MTRRPSGRRLAVAGALLLLVRAAPAAAGEPPTLAAVAVPGGPDVDARRSAALTDRLAAALGRTFRLERQAPLGGADERAGRERAERARRRGAEGAQLLVEMRTAEAARALSEAVAGLEAELPYVTRQEVVEALLALGVAHGLDGNARPAREAFRRALVVAPALGYDASRHPPALEPLFARERAAVRRARRSVLEVRARPAGEVFVDWASAGPAPAASEPLPAGVHYVAVHQEGFRPGTARVRLGARRRELVEVTLEPDVEGGRARAALGHLFDRELDGAMLAAVAGAARTERLLACRVADVAGQAVAEVALLDLPGRRRLALLSRAVPADDDDAARTLAAALLEQADRPPGRAALLPVPAGPGAPHLPPRDEPARPFYSRWWFWTAVGVVAVAAVAIPLALSGGDSGPPVAFEF